MRKLITTLITLMLILNSCRVVTEKPTTSSNIRDTYGVEFNKIRINIGLVPLDSSWAFKTLSIPDQYWWESVDFDSIKRKDISFYSAKKIYLINGNIHRETDEYVSKELYNQIDGQFRFLIWYTYEFEDSINYVDRWEYRLTKMKMNKKWAEGFSITKMQADSVLHSWGISRPGK